MTAGFQHEIAESCDEALMVDFGSQVTQFSARRVREACALRPAPSRKQTPHRQQETLRKSDAIAVARGAVIAPAIGNR
ncbi:MAG: hypothetical protein WBS22_19615 [Methylocystis sp.]